MFENFRDFRNTLSERIKSPFIGSFMITWGLIHWRVLVLFFYSEENLHIQERIEKIESYLGTQGFKPLILYPIAITMLVLLSYNALNGFGLLIKLLYDNWISPYIQKLLYNKAIIEKSKYENLKRKYETLKENYDSEKDRFLSSDNERNKIANDLATLKAKAFDAEFVGDITHIFNQNAQWVKTSLHSSGNEEREIFSCEKDEFINEDGSKVKSDNIRITKDGRIISFEKLIGRSRISTYLIKGDALNFVGFEDDKTLVSYKALEGVPIKVDSAKYKYENNYIDVTSKIQKMIDRGNHAFKVTNNVMNGDPGFGNQKTLHIEYILNKDKRTVDVPENDTVKLT
jgi:hypothetical protein